MSSSEREEELLIIQSIYCDAYNTFEAVDDTHFVFRSVPVVLFLTLPLSYPDPSHSPEISLDSDGLGVSRLQMFQLQLRLDSILQSKPGEPVLFELTEETREFTEGLRDDIKIAFEEEEENVYADMYVDVNDAEKRITDHAVVQKHMGSTTLESIMSRLPSTTKLLHAEVVLRTDLRAKYQARRRTIQQQATHNILDRRKKDTVWDELGKEEIVFHGTPRHNVGSIVRSGFVVPGQKTADGERVGVRCGSTWGMVGQILLTCTDAECPSTHREYTPRLNQDSVSDSTSGGVRRGRRLLPGQKLIVCAVVMGRRRLMTENQRHISTVESGFDSHVSPSRCEYIIFHSAQVLPLYVLHLGNGKKDFGPKIDRPLVPAGNLTDYARKHLPNGFGAATGHRFTVLEIAPIDDDEELWGEYQTTGAEENSGEFQDERRNSSYWSKYHQ
ncbi:hypothetical protein DXG01_003334 [Tephrocybe rancida]|nr:hypothetical protein DXG01_003334 [Tephrocybe rancida]